ncbi:hypothetical protein JD969_08375 [Planctomycetota bacterium]|nr:hypothetical protein JD969_08375 [Planctomycetota bacterium]
MRDNVITRLRAYSTATLLAFAMGGITSADTYIWTGADKFDGSDFSKITNWELKDGGIGSPFVGTLVDGHELLIDTTVPKVNGYANDRHNPTLYSEFYNFVNGAKLIVDDRLTELLIDDVFTGINLGSDTELHVSNGARIRSTSGVSGPIIGYQTGDKSAKAYINSNGSITATDLIVALTDPSGFKHSIAEVFVSGTFSGIALSETLSIGMSAHDSSINDATSKTFGVVTVENNAYVNVVNGADTGTIYVGQGTSGRLNVNDATVNTNIMCVGSGHFPTTINNSRTSGELVIDGILSDVRTDHLNVGENTRGSVTVSNQATLRADNLTIGLNRGHGIVRVESGGKLIMEPDFIGILSIGQEGSLDTSKLILTDQNTRMEVSNEVQTVFVGQASNAEWLVQDGATFARLHEGSTPADYYFGIKGSANNQRGFADLIVEGDGSRWEDATGRIRLGFGLAADGTTKNVGGLFVKDGGYLNADIIDAGTRLSNQYGQGNISIAGDGTKVIANTISVQGDRSNIYLTNGGDANMGTLNVDSESAHYVYSWNNGVVANATIEDQGSVLKLGSAYIGIDHAGAMYVTNEGVVRATGKFHVGMGESFDVSTSALLRADNNAYVRAVGGFEVAGGDSRHAEVQVLGGSYLTANGDIRLGIGSDSYGKLTVEGMGQATLTDSYGTFAHSRIFSSDDIITGVSIGSSGDIHVGDHGEIAVKSIFLQQSAGGTSEMVVDGENAAVYSNGTLHVGSFGDAQLTIREGKVSTNALIFANDGSARGRVTIIGKDSELIVYNGLNMINQYEARLDLYHSGQLILLDDLIANDSSIVNIFGGQLNARDIHLEPDTNPINWQTGTIALSSDQALYEGSTLDVLTYHYDSATDTSYNKLGAGKILYVGGELSMSKQLTIDGGTLIIDQFDSHAGLPLLELKKGKFGFYHSGSIGDGSPLGNRLMMNEDVHIVAGGPLTNNGWIGGSGVISDEIPTNLPSNPSASFFINEAEGVVHLDQDDHLFISMDGAVNNGTIEIFNARLTLDSSLLNNGHITGLNTYLRTTSIDNYGQMNYADTQHTLFGDITNNIDGTITVTRDARLTIHDDFDNQGELRISNDASVVIFGQFTGTGSITGGGTTYIEGELAPGNSPGLMDITGDIVLSDDANAQMELAGNIIGDEYDALTINGDLSLDGTLELLLIDGFNPLAGDAFQLFEATNIEGQFASLLLPTLIGNLSWDTTQLNTQGLISVIPEPTSLLLFTSFASLLTIRRRSA